MVTELPKAPLTTSEMALLLSLPPPPPPPSPPPSSLGDDPTLQLFYAQINGDPSDPTSFIPDVEKSSLVTKSEPQHHHHHHKDKKSVSKKLIPSFPQLTDFL